MIAAISADASPRAEWLGAASASTWRSVRRPDKLSTPNTNNEISGEDHHAARGRWRFRHCAPDPIGNTDPGGRPVEDRRAHGDLGRVCGAGTAPAQGYAICG